MPKVSVIIPVYNAQDVVRDTLQTVRDQTWKDHEIIVIDDGSKDGSGEIVQAFPGPVRYIRQANAGVAAARNRGIAESAGQYVALLDHDDLWASTKLERQVAVLEARPEVGMVVTDVRHIDKQGRPLDLVGITYNPHDEFARLFVRGYIPTPSATLIRRTVFEAVGHFDASFQSAGMDDHELWTRIADRYQIERIPEPLTYHRNRENKPATIGLSHRAILLPKLLERYGKDPEKRRFLLREQGKYLSDQGKQLLRQGRLGEARVYLWRGLLMGLRQLGSPKVLVRCAGRLAQSYLSSSHRRVGQ